MPPKAHASSAAAPALAAAAVRPLVALHGASLLLQVVAHPGNKGGDSLSVTEGALHVRTSAPPREGEANAAVVKAVAALFDVPKGRVEIVRGQKDREKVVAVAGAGEALLASAREALERLQ